MTASPTVKIWRSRGRFDFEYKDEYGNSFFSSKLSLDEAIYLMIQYFHSSHITEIDDTNPEEFERLGHREVE